MHMHKEFSQKAVEDGSDISIFVDGCLKAEADRNLSPISLKELSRYLKELGDYCKRFGLNSVTQLSSLPLPGRADLLPVDTLLYLLLYLSFRQENSS
ncbi:MAG: hypothetical protein ACMUIU_15245 [bacterium]